MDKISASFALNSSQKSVCIDSTAGWGLSRVPVPCLVQDVFDPRNISALSKDEGFDLSRWTKQGGDCCRCVPAFSLLGFDMGWIIHCSSQARKPQTLCHGCVDRAVGQLKPSNPTLQQVLCGTIPSRVTQPLPALLFHCFYSERDLEKALTIYSLSLCTCSGEFLGKCFSLDHQKFSVHVETVCTS